MARGNSGRNSMISTTAKPPELLWYEFVSRLPWEKGNLDVASYDALLRAASLGVPASTAIEEIAARIRAAGDYPRPHKLESQWRRASMHVKAEPSSPGPIVASQRPAFDPDYAKRIADRVPVSVDVRWLKRRSPVITWITPAEYLSAVFGMGCQVLVFTDPRSQGQTVYQKLSLKTERSALKGFERGHKDGVWFLSNPVDGQYHFNPRQDSMSRRSEESITDFRHVVLESDCQPLEQWLRILVQLKLPIVSIVSSGGKSLHALARVDASSKEDWDQKVRRLMPWLVKVGADRGAMTAVRLTRLPGCYRGDKLQELLYLNPNPASGPIWKEAQ
jgi:hypothetical protein